MITKATLKAHKTPDNNSIIYVQVPWNKTSLASVYNAVDDALEESLRGQLPIVDYSPSSYDSNSHEIELMVILDVEDVDFEEE